MSLLDVSELSVSYGDTTVVDHVGFAVSRGESVGLVGESGSGKSQTALAMLGLLPRQARVTGSVRLEGQELIGAKERVLDTVRGRRIGIVFHCFRHTRTTEWVKMGFSDEIIRRATGHKSLEAYRNYVKLDPYAVMRLVEEKNKKTDNSGRKSAIFL